MGHLGWRSIARCEFLRTGGSHERSDRMERVEIYRVELSCVPTFSIDVPLWSREEGRSDLTVSLTLVEFTPGLFETQIDDLRVQ